MTDPGRAAEASFSDLQRGQRISVAIVFRRSQISDAEYWEL